MIPPELRNRRQWVLWRYERRSDRDRAKVPWSADGRRKADVTKPATWGTLDDALTTLVRGRGRFDGVGFVFTATDPYAGVDLDGCIDASGTLHPDAAEIIGKLDAYAEPSPSGTGMHVILAAVLRTDRHRTPATPWGGALEVYDRERFFTITGNGTGTIADRQQQLDALVADLLPAATPRTPPRSRTTGPANVDDTELLRRAFTARNGRKLRALYDGDTTAHHGDDSAADLALCRALAFWTGPDPNQIDRLFRASRLHRDKWDEPRGTTTYGAATIDTAIASCTTFYQAHARPDDTDNDTTPPPHRVRTSVAVPSPSPGPGQVNPRNPNDDGGSDDAAARSEIEEEKQLWALLRKHREEGFEPEPIEGLGPLPARPTRAMRKLHGFLALCFGLRLADGTDQAMMMACSVLVRERIVTSKQGANNLLREFMALGIIWSPGEMPKLGKGNGTRLILPGPKPPGSEPPGGWLEAGYRVLPAVSDGVPDATVDGGAVPVEAEDVEGGVPVQPAVEAPDEPLMAGAVDGCSALGLDGVAASGGGAEGAFGNGRHVPDDNAVIGAEGSDPDELVAAAEAMPQDARSLAIDCPHADHAGREWRRCGSDRWTCSTCHPPAAGVEVVWSSGP